MNFLVEGFLCQIKNDLFADFHNGLEITEIFYGNTYKEAHFPKLILLCMKTPEGILEKKNCLTLIDTVYCLDGALCFLRFCCSHGN